MSLPSLSRLAISVFAPRNRTSLNSAPRAFSEPSLIFLPSGSRRTSSSTACRLRRRQARDSAHPQRDFPLHATQKLVVLSWRLDSAGDRYFWHGVRASAVPSSRESRGTFSARSPPRRICRRGSTAATALARPLSRSGDWRSPKFYPIIPHLHPEINVAPERLRKRDVRDACKRGMLDYPKRDRAESRRENNRRGGETASRC